MYSNMCVKIALCLALIVCIDGNVLKQNVLKRTLPLSAEGMTVEITVRSKEDPRHPLQTIKIDINEMDKKVEMSMSEAPSGVLKHLFKTKNKVSTLESRSNMVLGRCAAGFTFRKGFCIPDDY